MRKNLKTAAGIIASLVIFVLICSKLNYLYVTYDQWHRVLFHSYYKQENIDNLFLGSSHVYCDVNPFILDEINGQNNFNLATPKQRWDNTYFLLKEALANHDIKNVYLECYFWTNTEFETWTDKKKGYETVDVIKDPANFNLPWLITYEMKPSLNSMAMLCLSSDLDHLFETIFPFVRYRANIFNWGQIQANMDAKNSEGFKNYTYRQDIKDADGKEGYMEYREKGFHLTEKLRLLDSEKLIEDFRDLDKYGISKESEKYMRKAIKLCQKKNVNVKLFISPIYDLQILSADDYDSYLSELHSIAEDCGVELYDFNLAKKDYLDIKNSDLFMDTGHLNSRGAKYYTPILHSTLTKSKKDNEKHFFKTYKERLAEEDFEIYGLYYKDIKPDGAEGGNKSPAYTARKYTVAASRKNVRYKITKTMAKENEDGEEVTKTLQEYSKNNSFDLPIGEHGTINIEGLWEGESRSIFIDY